MEGPNLRWFGEEHRYLLPFGRYFLSFVGTYLNTVLEFPVLPVSPGVARNQRALFAYVMGLWGEGIFNTVV